MAFIRIEPSYGTSVDPKQDYRTESEDAYQTP